jgi:hypothetical protein
MADELQQHDRRLPMRMILSMFLMLAFLPSPASALTVQDLATLSKAGVSDEVLLALIDRDKPVFAIDSDQVLALTRDGVSEKLLIAMLRSGREPSQAPSAQTAAALPVEPIVVIVGDKPTPHEFAHAWAPEVIYFVPYIPVAPARVAGPCQPGRLTTPTKTIGLADASGKFVNNALLPVLAAAEAGATDCAQTPFVQPAHRPRR